MATGLSFLTNRSLLKSEDRIRRRRRFIYFYFLFYFGPKLMVENDSEGCRVVVLSSQWLPYLLVLSYLIHTVLIDIKIAAGRSRPARTCPWLTTGLSCILQLYWNGLLAVAYRNCGNIREDKTWGKGFV